jgi:hypothetical protein
MYSASQLSAGRQNLAQGSVMLQNLVDLVEAGGTLSLAEEEYTCSFLAVSHAEGDGSFLDLHELSYCKNYSFTGCYLAYQNNLEGLLVARNAFGPIAPDIIAKDIVFLEEQYQEWKRIIRITNHSDALLQHVAKEARNHLKNSEKFARNSMMGERLRNAFLKAVVLHSKYLYLKIREFYQELRASEQMMHICGHEIVIDSFAFYHVLFRHFAPRATRYQNDASYFTDQTIKPENLPNHIIYFLTEYAIWFKDAERHVGGAARPILRLQTFYPVTQPRELEYVANLTEQLTANGLGLFFAV